MYAVLYRPDWSMRRCGIQTSIASTAENVHEPKGRNQSCIHPERPVVRNPSISDVQKALAEARCKVARAIRPPMGAVRSPTVLRSTLQQ